MIRRRVYFSPLLTLRCLRLDRADNMHLQIWSQFTKDKKKKMLHLRSEQTESRESIAIVAKNSVHYFLLKFKRAMLDRSVGQLEYEAKQHY